MKKTVPTDAIDSTEPAIHEPSWTVVVAAASRHGSTEAIAARLAGVLAAQLSDRWTVELSDLSDLRQLESADAVVLGSAIYMGHWMRSAQHALETVKDSPLLDLWLFSTGPISEKVGEYNDVIKAAEMVEFGCAVEHVMFAGSLDTSALAWWERIIVNAVHTVSGDRRDWAAIDAWGTSIATQLTHAVSATDPRSTS